MKSLSPRISALMTCCLALLSPAIHAVEILRWERLPLVIPLIVDQERVVFIDRNIRVGSPASLADRLRIQSTGGVIYLRANSPIEPTRLQLQDAKDGTVILVDIVAEPAQANQPPLEPVRIIEMTAASPSQPENGTPTQSGTSQQATPLPVILTRYAAQSLYAPLRTVEPVAGITRVNLRRDLALDTLLPTLPIHAQALASWRVNNVWVSAVRLRNTASHTIDLDPRSLQGKFVAATFQHQDLGPAGTPDDTTVVYLVTHEHGLTQALLPNISPIDTTLNLPKGERGDHAK